MVTSLFQCAIDAHQHRLGIRASLAAIAIAVLTDQHGRSDRTFRMIVIKRHTRFVQKREQVILVTSQPFDQAAGFLVLSGGFNHGPQTHIQAGPTRCPLGDREILAIPQANRITNQATQLLGKSRPIRVHTLVGFNLFQVTQQMDQAHLSFTTSHRIVGALKVANQGAVEFFLEKFHQGRTPASTVDHIIRHLRCRKTPQPVGLAVDPPAGFVGVQHGRLQCLGLNRLVPGKKDRLQAIPHLNQAARCQASLQVIGENLDDLRECVAQTVVRPRQQDQNMVTQRGLGLFVGGHHARWRRRQRGAGRRGRGLLGQRQQGKDDRFLALVINLPRPLFRKQGANRYGLQRLRRSFHNIYYRKLSPNYSIL